MPAPEQQAQEAGKLAATLERLGERLNDQERERDAVGRGSRGGWAEAIG